MKITDADIDWQHAYGIAQVELTKAKAELERLRAALLNIQALAERGNPIDNAKLATQCRRALDQQLGEKT